MFETPFEKDKNRNSINFVNADIVFVSDYFTDEYSGGAELSTKALFDSAPYKVFLLKSSELNENLIHMGLNKTWVFFNFTQLNMQLIPAVVSNLNYMLVEYDYKFCQYRSIERHKNSTGEDCDCHQQNAGKMISAFFAGAEHIFWMSEKQKQIYVDRFSFINELSSSVLSSIFDLEDLEYIEKLRIARKSKILKDKTVVIKSNSWIKGTEETKNHLDEQQIDFDLIGDLNYRDLLEKLSEYTSLTFQPLGGDTCPRVVIEAKLLGLEVNINEHVQHAGEDWWKTDDLDSIERYLLDGHNRFWNRVESFLSRHITISGYTQAYNVKNSNYPWKESISSLLGFCDEVVVLDGGSTDGTWEELQVMAKLQGDGKLIVKQLKRNWDDPRFALFNGQQKAAARTLCTKEWCWQVDIDEVVHEKDYDKVRTLLRQMPKSAKLISLPVIEYWGGSEKVRIDVNPWKWRLSKNDPHITHGVNLQHRRYDEEGHLFSAGSDGDDYISTDSYQLIPDTNFYTPELHKLRVSALNGDKDALTKYQEEISNVVDHIPGVHHYSWFDLKRKVYSYKNFWSKHWASLYNRVIDDVPENNMFFDKKWSDVTDKEIEEISQRMKKEMGGWIFHERIDFNKPTPSIRVEKNHPAVMKDWIEKHEGGDQ